MNRFCANCGNEIAAGSNFCSKCGASVEGNNHQELNFKIPERNIALCLIYTIITCGIYGVYWFICITDEVNAVSKEDWYFWGYVFLIYYSYLRYIWILLGVLYRSKARCCWKII